MNALKLKKQISLLVFLPFIFVSSYTNTYNTSLLPIMLVTSYITELDLERAGVIRQVGDVKLLKKQVKKFANDLVSKFIEKIKISLNNYKYIETFQKTIVGNKAVVLNRGSPVFN